MDLQFLNVEAENANLEAIENRLFQVEKVQLSTNLEGYEIPESYGMYKKGGGNTLGVVGRVFTPTQPEFLYKSILECAINSDLVDLENMEFNEYFGGSKIAFRLPMKKKIQFTNLQGEADESQIFIDLKTGFDGRTSTSLGVSIFRLICSNGMKGYKTEFNVSVKNTIGNVGKVGSMMNDFSKVLVNVDNLNEMIAHLNSVEINSQQADEFVKRVLGYNQKEYNDLSTRKQNILTKVMESMELELNRTGRNAWGLVNGITYYTNHGTGAENKEEYTMFKRGAELNDKAQKFALELA